MKMKNEYLKLGVPAVIGLAVLGGILSTGISDPLDGRFYYTMEEATAYFLSLSQEKAALYILCERFDLVFIFAYSLFFFFAFSFAYPNKSKWKWYALAPGFFDLIETTAILQALQVGPTPSITSWLGMVTMLKWTTAGIAVGMLGLKLKRSFGSASR